MFDIEKIDINDEDIYKIIGDKRTKGLFQVESHLAKTWAGKIKPSNIGELSDLIAIIRPSSLNFAQEYVDVKNGTKEVSYIDKRLEPILKPFKGIILYQETIIKIIQELANESECYSDSVRLMISKKKLDELKKELPILKNKFIKNGMAEDSAEALIKMISYAGSYAFNLSHSAVYSKNLATIASIKSNYPIVFFWANLQTANQKQHPLEELRELYYDAKDFGINIIPPTICDISENFEIVDMNNIKFGFSNIKGVGESCVKNLKKCDTSSFKSFLVSSIAHKVKKNVVEVLIKCGALDCFKIPRVKMLLEYAIIKSLSDEQESVFLELYKTKDVVDSVNEIILNNSRLKVNDETKQLLLDYVSKEHKDYMTTNDIWERETLGINISSSRLDSYAQDSGITHNLSMVKKAFDREKIVVIALLEKVKKTKTKKDKKDMAFLTISDLTAQISNCIVFPELFTRMYYEKNCLKNEGLEVLKITGYKSINDNGESFIAQDIEVF